MISWDIYFAEIFSTCIWMVFTTGTIIIGCNSVCSLFAIGSQLSPEPHSSGIEVLETDGFKLHCYQTMTGDKSDDILAGVHMMLSYTETALIVGLLRTDSIESGASCDRICKSYGTWSNWLLARLSMTEILYVPLSHVKVYVVISYLYTIPWQKSPLEVGLLLKVE